MTRTSKGLFVREIIGPAGRTMIVWDAALVFIGIEHEDLARTKTVRDAAAKDVAALKEATAEFEATKPPAPAADTKPVDAGVRAGGK